MKFYAAFFSILLTSCGYHFHSSESPRPSVNVLPIRGDHDGQLAQALAEAFSQSKIVYRAFEANYDIEIQFSQFDTTHTDYQYQTDDETDEIINRLSPVEGQHDIVVNVTLFKKDSKKKFLGPIQFRQTYNYDFSDFRSYNDLSFTDLEGANQTTLSYSLGQLAAEDDAKVSAKRCLYEKISKKIVAYLSLKLD